MNITNDKIRGEMVDAAVNIICDALQLDKEYYETWKENISVAFQDAYKTYIKDKPLFFEELPNTWVHDVSNDAANKFLQSVIHEKND